MDKPLTIELYTTLGCHLCEDAMALLQQLDGIKIKEIEIANDDALIEQYGIRIPVVKTANSERELGWPFDLLQLQAFVSV